MNYSQFSFLAFALIGICTIISLTQFGLDDYSSLAGIGGTALAHSSWVNAKLMERTKTKLCAEEEL